MFIILGAIIFKVTKEAGNILLPYYFPNTLKNFDIFQDSLLIC